MYIFFVYVQACLRKDTIFSKIFIFHDISQNPHEKHKNPRAGATPGFQPRPAGGKGVKKLIEMDRNCYGGTA
jgi:hypothetical protein